MSLTQRFYEWRCSRVGHDWLGPVVSEYVTTTSICIRCGVYDWSLPWGDCVGPGGVHPLAAHYRLLADGPVTQPVGPCFSPR